MFLKEQIFAFSKFNVVECVFIGFNSLVFDYMGESTITGDEVWHLSTFRHRQLS